MKIIYVILTFIISEITCDARSNTIVSVENGEIRGQKAHDESYTYFLGIPYSMVDSENPFGPSKPLQPFKGVYEAYDASKKCPQAFLKVGGLAQMKHRTHDNEILDCLRLNVFAPREANPENLLPVLVWIHGGAFSGGSSGEDGVPNVVKHGIVVVTLNYRLGPYGFFCLDIPAVPGNQGLKDQSEALRWVRKNIASFGGDPYNVTLGGVSAGACSALLHLYSPEEKLFNKLIAESGAPQVEGMFEIGKEDAALKIANQLGFITNNTNEALHFLSQAPPQDVMQGMVDSEFRLMPCKERKFPGLDTFVGSDPFSLSNAENINSIPILIGHANRELSLEYGRYNNKDIYNNTIRNMFDFNSLQLQKIVDIVEDFYTGDENSDLSEKSQEFDGDITFNHPIKRTVDSLVERSTANIYAYVFTYVGNTNSSGAHHSAEVRYLFQNERANNLAAGSSADDILISDRLTTMWANFIKYGNPTPQKTDLLPIIWEPANKRSRPYLEVGSVLKLKHRVFNKRMSFWDLFYLQYGKYHYLIKN